MLRIFRQLEKFQKIELDAKKNGLQNVALKELLQSSH